MGTLHSISCGHERQQCGTVVLPCAWPGCREGREAKHLVVWGQEALANGRGVTTVERRFARSHQTAPAEAWRWVEQLPRGGR